MRPRDQNTAVLTLRARLLLGLTVGVLVPFVVFYFVGSSMLRSALVDTLGRHVLQAQARATGDRIGTWLGKMAALAEFVSQSTEVRGRFLGDRGTSEFEAWRLRTWDRLSQLGHLTLIAADGEVLFDADGGLTSGNVATREPWSKWLAGAREGSSRFWAPTPDPFRVSVSDPRDPSRYVLPLVAPMRDDTDRLLGAFVSLLPFSHVQDVIEESRSIIANAGRMPSGMVWLAGDSRFLLHTVRTRIGMPVPDAAPTDRVAETERIDAHGLPWRVGVSADSADVFGKVSAVLFPFLVLVLAVLGATLGIATTLSLASTRPLAKLERVTEELGAGDLGARAEETGSRETRKLAEALNAMAAQLADERERLKVAERDRAWTKMARQVAHEIKNPLQPVRLHAELLQRLLRKAAPGDDERQRGQQSADVILRQVDALRRIVGDFNAFAEASMPLKEKERFQVADVLQELARLYSTARADGKRVTIEGGAAGAELTGSALRVQQVLVNLIQNALEASLDGGLVEVTARVEGKRWIAEVRDRGPGLPEGGATVAFEPSYSTKPGGTGLGLAISQRNIDAMHGTITLEPRPDGGVIARVELPDRGGAT
ncbi:MAG: sensor histidine kinase [Planctomycetota bacterium]|jgi:signal transduction histidine kinase|nr:sensor histidine kinase [Planctomycetota bacterium]